MFRILISLCLIFILPGLGQANGYHLNIEEHANEIFKINPNALSLEQVQKMTVRDDLNVQVSYEKLLQAQRKIGEARAQYFPYGIGAIGAMYLLNIWNPVLLIELFTSLPSKVYNVHSEKNIGLAEKYSLEALKENIKSQVATLYLNILKEEAALKLTKIQIGLYETLLKSFEERVNLGISTQEEVKDIERRLFSLRDTYLKFSGYLSSEKSAFNQMIANSPFEAKNIELRPIANFLTTFDFKLERESLIKSAIVGSNELIAADYMIKAACKNRKSIKWSILSFNGIGFGYWGRIQVAGSMVNEAKINRQLTEDNLINQVYVAENTLVQYLKLFESEKAILADTRFYMDASLERFQEGMIPLDELIETEFIFLKDFNEFVIAHYNSHSKLNDLERVIMSKVRRSNEDSTTITADVKIDNYKRNWYSLIVGPLDDQEILKVEYIFDDYLELRPMTSFAAANNFKINLKLFNPKSVGGLVILTLANGNTIKQKFHFD